jgi:hypothetical protein
LTRPTPCQPNRKQSNCYFYGAQQDVEVPCARQSERHDSNVERTEPDVATAADGLGVLGYPNVEKANSVEQAPFVIALVETSVRKHSTEPVIEALEAKEILM